MTPDDGALIAQRTMNERFAACLVALACEQYGNPPSGYYPTRICRHCDCGTSGGGCWPNGCWYCALNARKAAA